MSILVERYKLPEQDAAGLIVWDGVRERVGGI